MPPELLIDTAGGHLGAHLAQTRQQVVVHGHGIGVDPAGQLAGLKAGVQEWQLEHSPAVLIPALVIRAMSSCPVHAHGSRAVPHQPGSVSSGLRRCAGWFVSQSQFIICSNRTPGKLKRAHAMTCSPTK